MPRTPGMNPFLPFDIYIPDGEPKVFGDRLYLYGSFDLFSEGYCSGVYHTVSAPLTDLTDWTDHGVSFSVKDVPWSDALLYAPDAARIGDKYYLFFCLSDGSEGVAESDSPAGPFTNARRITLDGRPIEGIDPSVLVDGEHIYYTWGQFGLNMGELESDLCTLKPGSVHKGVITNRDGGEGFHEGSSLRKIGRRYCLIYASEYTDVFPNRGGRPTKLDYAVSDSPFGPYERRGTVIDNTGCDPASWNNHGSVIKAGNDWYVFYHASSNNSAFSRRARAEKLSVDEENCKIWRAEPTGNGFVPAVTPQMLVSPVHACRFFGGAYVTQTPDGRFPAVGLRSGAGFSFSPAFYRAGTWSLTVTGRFFEETEVRLQIGDAEAAETVRPGDTAAQLHLTTPETRAETVLTFFGKENAALCEIDALAFRFQRSADLFTPYI